MIFPHLISHDISSSRNCKAEVFQPPGSSDRLKFGREDREDEGEGEGEDT